VKNKLALLMSILGSAQNTHPFVPRRLFRLKEWAGSEAYRNILGGDYVKDVLGTHEGGERLTCECGTIVNSKLSFCPECGRSLHREEESAELACGGCGEPLPGATKFCPKCGAKQIVAEPTGPEVGTLGKLRNTAASFLKNR
jgi:RNA polymerase subunit RPABC4/transcription elongation factor Spt4